MILYNIIYNMSIYIYILCVCVFLFCLNCLLLKSPEIAAFVDCKSKFLIVGVVSFFNITAFDHSCWLHFSPFHNPWA